MERISKMWRSALAMVLAICMVLSFCPVAAFAAEEEIKYVSLGDSMTNGYGLPGYDKNSGVEDYGNGSYANQFATEIGATSHAQLAMSAMRAEDLHWLLELNYNDAAAIALTEGAWDEAAWNAKFTTGDYWTWNEICTHGRTKATTDAIKAVVDASFYPATYKGGYNGDVALIAKYFQESVKNADVVSLGMGNGNFGVFMFGRIMEAIGFAGTPDDALIYKVDRALAECPAAVKAQVLSLKSKLYSALEAKLGVSISSDPTMEALANTVIYTALSYVLNYAGSVEAILKLNPDAEIVLVELMNTFSDGTKNVAGVTLGDLMNAVYKPLNAFIAGLPTVMQAAGNSVYANATFYYAEANGIQCMVDTYGDDFLKGDGTPNEDSIIRDRFVESIVGYCDCDTTCSDLAACPNWENGMVWGLMKDIDLMGMKLTRISYADVLAYVSKDDAGKAEYAAGNAEKALSISVYLAFESAVSNAGKNGEPVTIDAIMGLGNMDTSLFDGVMNDLMANIETAGEAKLSTAAAFVASNSEGMLTAGEVIKLKSGELKAEDKAYAVITDKVQDEYSDVTVGDIKTMLTAATAQEGAIAVIQRIIGSEANVAEVIELGVFGYAAKELNNGATAADIEAAYNDNTLDPADKKKIDDLKDIVESVNTLAGKRDEISDGFATAKSAMEDAVEATDMLCMLLALPETLGTSLKNEASLAGLLGLFSRCVVGNGLGGHPSQGGHNKLAESVIAAYGKHTAKDETVENINYVLGELKNFLEKYGPEAADQAYKLWVDKGYQALVDQYITELTTNVTDRYTNYTEVVLPAINSALDALNAQKITLTTELATLKTQLLAKKAELEKVLAEQEITDITPPEFDIDTELGNNEQTQVPENDCAGVGSVADELAAAIADLEHAIAVIEALIADVTADIEDLVALATEIAEGVATLEQTLTDVAAAAQDLKNAVDAVVTVLTDDSAKAASKTFMKAFNAARDAALVAVDTVELLVKTANEDVATIEASVATLKEGMNALVNKLCTDWENADKEALLQKIINKLPTSAQVIVGGSVLLVQQTLEENQAAIINKLNAEKDALKVKLDADKEVVLKELAEKKAALEAEYGPQIAAAQAKIDALKAQIDTEIQTKYAELQVAAQAKIDALTLEAQAKIAALDAELQGYVAQLAGDITDEVRETIQAQIDRINNDIAAVNADLACAIEHVDAELKAAYDALVEEVTNAYNDVMTELQNAYNALVDAFETAIKELQDAADNAIQGLIDAYEAAIKALQDAADKAIQELIDAAKKELEKLGEIGEILSELMDSVLAAIHGDVAKAQAAINEILHGALDSVNDLADALVDLGIDTVNTIVDEVTKVINDMLHEATHADLELGAESLYIALGDGTAAPESYVEKLAAQLEAEYGVENYTNYAQAGNTAGAEVAKVADRAGIADADLITIGFGNATIVETAIRNADSVEYDWAGLVGADLVPYVEDALAEVYAEIANADMSEDMAEFVNSIVEGLAYGAVEYAVELPALIAAIREVNADAVIVIVGQYNPMEDVVLEMGGSTLDLSEYIGYFVDAVAVHGIGYAMITGDAIFVEAPEVDTNNTDTSWSEIDLLKMLMNPKGFEVLNPSESGDTYITNQILGALNITKIEEEPAGLWGDANDNGKVNIQDAILILKFAVGESVTINQKLSDVTGEGSVKINDAIWVLKRSVGEPDLFPVEK